MSSSHLPQKQQPLDPILWTAFGVCLVCIVLLAVAFSNTTTSNHSKSSEVVENSDPTRFPPLSIDMARLQRERRAQQSESRLGSVDDELSHLYSVVRRSNLAQFPRRAAENDTDPIILTAEVTFAADEVLPASGVRGFTAAGEPIFAACNEGIEELLQAIRLKNIPLDEAKHNPPPERFQKYRENCGNALTMLINHGLVTTDGRWKQPYSATLFDILNRFRWAHIAHARLPARLQLAPYEYELIMRWRIESPDAFSIAERKKFISQATAEIPGYDAALALILIENEGKDRDQAIENLRQLSEKEPKNNHYSRRYQRALQFQDSQ